MGKSLQDQALVSFLKCHLFRDSQKLGHRRTVCPPCSLPLPPHHLPKAPVLAWGLCLGFTHSRPLGPCSLPTRALLSGPWRRSLLSPRTCPQGTLCLRQPRSPRGQRLSVPDPDPPDSCLQGSAQEHPCSSHCESTNTAQLQGGRGGLSFASLPTSPTLPCPALPCGRQAPGRPTSPLCGGGCHVVQGLGAELRHCVLLEPAGP